MNYKEILLAVQEVWYSLNDDRFKEVCKNAQIPTHEVRNMIDLKRRGMIPFIAEAPEELVMATVDFKKVIDNWQKHFIQDDNPKLWQKYIYQVGDEIKNREINLSSYDGLRYCLSLYEEADKILYIQPMCDSVSKDKKYQNVYKGDIIAVQDKYGKPLKMVVCFLKDGYIHPQPYYKELVYTEQYGYLNAEGKLFTGKDDIIFEESLFNMEGRDCNSHVISICSDWEVVGNVTTDIHLLKPSK
jgi:hypothetical protein